MKGKDINKVAYKKAPSKMERITKIVVWVMLIAMLGSGLLTVIYTLMNYV